MSENFNPKLLILDTGENIDAFMTPELISQIQLIKNLCLKIQQTHESIIQNIDEKSKDHDQNDIEMVKKFVNVCKSIPLHSISDKEVIILMYNYNLTGEYVNKIAFIIRQIF